MKILLPLITCIMLSPAFAEEADDYGTLNPDEMTLSSAIKKAARGEVNMMVCAQGYAMTKKGDHDDARTVFEECAKQGWTAAMTWMSHMDHNGLGAKESAKSAAEWDKKAADAGDTIGVFNYGVDLLRGHGVEQDLDLGKSYINRAAKAGFKDAIRLKGADYNTEEITPDADNWKYDKRVF